MPGFQGPALAGVKEMLFGGDFVAHGLVALRPVLVLWLPALGSMWRRDRTALLVLAAAPLASILAMARFRFFWGGTTADARYVVAVVPLLVPLALLWDDLRRLGAARHLARGGFLALTAWSIGGAAHAVATFDGHPIRELPWPLSPWDASRFRKPVPFRRARPGRDGRAAGPRGSRSPSCGVRAGPPAGGRASPPSLPCCGSRRCCSAAASRPRGGGSTG